MITYKRGDVILVPFPFSDQVSVKKRPAVIISSHAYNKASIDIIIMAITSRIEKITGIGECLVQDWQGCGLVKLSAIKPAIATIKKTLILKKLGELSTFDLFSMERALSALIEVKALLH